ncbi:serine/threonine-protein kinase Sgk2 [Xylaria intraflava]|nr:serine/threonine-protein kinase Sgk2 [Xylaria intraflava]
MDQLTPGECEIIRQNPLDALDALDADSPDEPSWLDHICQALRDTETETAAITSSETDIETPLFDDDATTPQPQPRRSKLFNRVMQELVVQLMASNVSLEVASRAGHQNLLVDLSLVRRRIASHGVNHWVFRRLASCVIVRAPDVDVWTAVIGLILNVLRPTPPTTAVPSFETPITHSSASLQDSEETRLKVEARVFDEIHHCTYQAVGGFHEKYFEGCAWDARAKRVWERAESRHRDGRWSQLPDVPTEDEVYNWNWWFRMQSDLLADERAAYHRSTLSNRVGPGASRQLDLIVKKNRGGGPVVGEAHDWGHVLVVGELKMSNRNSKALLLQVGSAVRNIFAAQPTRLFVHAFTLVGATMETWVFDRSGPYSGPAFNIHEQPEKFIKVLCGYLMMSDQELGLDVFTERRGGGLFVTVPCEDRGTKRKRELELDPNPVAYQRAIVCRGTSCFLARAKGASDYDSVVKFSWTSSMRLPEADLLRKAERRGVKGLARVVGYQEEITSISKLRKDLTFPAPYRFRGIPGNSNNNSRQSASLSNASQRKRKSTDASSQSSKRSRHSSQAVKDGIHQNTDGDGTTSSGQEPQGTSLAPRDEHRMAYDDRILRVLAVSPAGRSIRQFRSGAELLQGLRDAITVHQSLYLDAKILHRDISENNIIITDPSRADGFRGMLIDLDLAKEEGRGASGARHRTGTMEFMAIEVLLGISHTYRHDLEAFFYVLIWLCARRGWDRPPAATMLARWYTGTYDEIAQSKRGDMDRDGLELILREFPPKFDFIKPLCREIRAILFPFKGSLFTGTPENPKVLYDPMIKAFDDTLATSELIPASAFYYR